MRIAIIGYGAIGHVVERALQGRAQLVIVDRTRAPLREGEKAVDAAVICVKTHGTEWAADVAKRLIARDGVGMTPERCRRPDPDGPSSDIRTTRQRERRSMRSPSSCEPAA
jgi:ketopantoate reductase